MYINELCTSSVPLQKHLHIGRTTTETSAHRPYHYRNICTSYVPLQKYLHIVRTITETSAHHPYLYRNICKCTSAVRQKHRPYQEETSAYQLMTRIVTSAQSQQKWPCVLITEDTDEYSVFSNGGYRLVLSV